MTQKTECPYCEGCGEIMDGRKVTSRSIDPPMVICPECNGSGEVDADDADDIDTNRTLRDYEQDYEQMRAEARWERERDGD